MSHRYKFGVWLAVLFVHTSSLASCMLAQIPQQRTEFNGLASQSQPLQITGAQSISVLSPPMPGAARTRLTDNATSPVVPARHVRTIPEARRVTLHSSESFVPNCQCETCTTVGHGSWHWLRDETEERRRTIQIYNTQCVRCHGVQGRGVWDIPDVPNFTNQRWQLSRSDWDIVRLTLNGRGACMPAFKGTITTDEAWALARYIRDLGRPAKEREPDDSKTESGSATDERKAVDQSNRSEDSMDEGTTEPTTDEESPEEVQTTDPVFFRAR